MAVKNVRFKKNALIAECTNFIFKLLNKYFLKISNNDIIKGINNTYQYSAYTPCCLKKKKRAMDNKRFMSKLVNIKVRR